MSRCRLLHNNRGCDVVAWISLRSASSLSHPISYRRHILPATSRAVHSSSSEVSSIAVRSHRYTHERVCGFQEVQIPDSFGNTRLMAYLWALRQLRTGSRRHDIPTAYNRAAPITDTRISRLGRCDIVMPSQTTRWDSTRNQPPMEQESHLGCMGA